MRDALVLDQQARPLGDLMNDGDTHGVLLR